MRLYSSYMTLGIEQLTCRHRNIFFASKNLSTFFLNILGGSSYNKSLDDEEIFLRVNNLHPYGVQVQETESQEQETIAEDLYNAFSQYYFSSPSKEKKATLIFLANEKAMSARSLQRKLKQETGLSFTGHHSNYRLEKSKQLLQQSYHSSEVSHLLCFSSPSHFSYCFKKKYGVTPSHYVESLNVKMMPMM